MTSIQPRPGFNWSLVAWGAPNETRTEHCSYCGDALPEQDEPHLILWTGEGWCAEFCDHCAATWFGMETFPEPPEEDE